MAANAAKVLVEPVHERHKPAFELQRVGNTPVFEGTTNEASRVYAYDLVIFDSQHKLIPANRWQVFEERTFRSRRSETPEPREALVIDVTGDGRNDLVVLVHDRILVYPQE